MSCGQMSTYYSNGQNDAGLIAEGNELNSDYVETFSIEDKILAQNIEAWVKYGSAMFIYHCLTHLFFQGPGTNFLTVEGVKLFFFVLLGFTLYFTFVKPNLPMKCSEPLLADLFDDLMKFGTVLIGARTLQSISSTIVGGDGVFFDGCWARNSVFVLTGFAIYRIFINPYAPTHHLKTDAKNMLDDWLQFTTMLVAVRVLDGETILDKTWLSSLLFIMIGFASYHFGIKKIVNPK